MTNPYLESLLHDEDLHPALPAALAMKRTINGTELSIEPGANLYGANLYGADLGEANLSYATLRGANLRSADLSEVNLSYANLRGADLNGANLHGANLNGADLHGADLHGANLRGANLRSANLYGANLRDANLSGADLSDASFRGADLYGVVGNMREIKSAQFDTYSCAWSCTPDGITLLSIGCQSHDLEKWRLADPQWIAAMADNATDWWASYGAILLALVDASPAVPSPVPVS